MREVGAADIDRDDGVGVQSRDLDREIVDGPAVHAETGAHGSGREESGQGARGVHRIRPRDIAEPGSPHTVCVARSTLTVLTNPHWQLVERAGRDIGVAQRAQRLAGVDGRGAAPLEQHADVIQPKQIPPLQERGTLGHRPCGRAGCAGGRDECADARPA